LWRTARAGRAPSTVARATSTCKPPPPVARQALESRPRGRRQQHQRALCLTSTAASHARGRRDRLTPTALRYRGLAAAEATNRAQRYAVPPPAADQGEIQPSTRQGGAESGEAGGGASRIPGQQLASPAAHHQQQQRLPERQCPAGLDQRLSPATAITVPLTSGQAANFGGGEISRAIPALPPPPTPMQPRQQQPQGARHGQRRC